MDKKRTAKNARKKQNEDTAPVRKAAPKPEMIYVPYDTDQIKCDGGGGALGHPLVWYSFGDKNNVECGYCDRLFIREKAA